MCVECWIPCYLECVERKALAVFLRKKADTAVEVLTQGHTDNKQQN